MTRGDEDGAFTPEEALGVGAITQLTEAHAWGDHDRDEYEEELAKKRPVGFAPWPPEGEQNDA